MSEPFVQVPVTKVRDTVDSAMQKHAYGILLPLVDQEFTAVVEDVTAAVVALLSQPTPATERGSAAQLLRELAEADPEAHRAALARGYGVEPLRLTTDDDVADAQALLDEVTAEPPRTEDMAPGRRWAEGVYAINFQPGYYPSIVMPDTDGWDLLYEDGTWYNPSEGDTLTRLDPSTIRDVTPPTGGVGG